MMKHAEDRNSYSMRTSLTEADDNAWRLGVAQYTMHLDGTASVRSFVVEPDTVSAKPDLVGKVLSALGLSAYGLAAPPEYAPELISDPPGGARALVFPRAPVRSRLALCLCWRFAQVVMLAC